MRFSMIAVLLAVFCLTESALADRNILEIVPLSARNRPIYNCAQKAAVGISWRDEKIEVAQAANGSDDIYLFAGLKSAHPTLPAVCYDTPMISGCIDKFPAMIQMPNRRMIQYIADLPDLRIFVAGRTVGHPTDNIVYSKVIDMNFAPCPDVALPPIPVLAPGNGIPTVSTAANGPVGHPLRNREPVAKWIYGPYAGIGGPSAPSEFTIALVAYEKNIEKVIFTLTPPTGPTGSVEVLGTQTRIDKVSGARAFVARVRSVDLPNGVSKIGAIVKPIVGLPVFMSGPITSEQQRVEHKHEIQLFNNLNGEVTLRTFHVRTNGSTNAYCGTTTDPCVSMHHALASYKNQFGPAPSVGGPTDVSGLTIQFGPGTFEIGTSLPFWPGWVNTRWHTTLRGTKNSIGKILTTINRTTNLEPYGYPGRHLLGMSRVRVEDMNLQSDPTSFDPRGFLVGPGSDGPDTAVEVINTHFQGLGLDANGTCQTQSDGIRLTLATVFGSTFARFAGNGNQSYVNTYVSNAGIASSNSPLLLNFGAEVDQTGRNPGPNGLMVGCQIDGPHGDVVKSAPGNQYAAVVVTPFEILMKTQGNYPTAANYVHRDFFIKVGPAGWTEPEGWGRSTLALLGGGNAIFDNYTTVGGPRSLEGTNATSGVYFANSFWNTTLPGLDSGYTGMNFPLPPLSSPQTWQSPATGATYYVGSGNVVLPPAPSAALTQKARKADLKRKQEANICTSKRAARKQLRGRAKTRQLARCQKRLSLGTFLIQ